MIIDHIDKLQLLKEQETKYFNEIKSIGYLAQGLWFLYKQVQEIETKITSSMDDVDKVKQVYMYGNAPGLEGVPQGMVACAFHWYSVSVCNYVRMVGWLSYSQDKDEALDYLKRIIPTVKTWRDKVSAHFAEIDPKWDDNPADLIKSVMFPISFESDAFYANSLTLTMTSGGKTSTSRPDMSWSLTHIHRALIPRYWPDQPPYL